jgi:sortase A
MRQYLAIAVFMLAGWQLGAGIWIHTKASLAQVLIESAWLASIEDKQPHKPWPWADTWPVARMIMNKEELFILEGAQGNSLAFAPGHLQGTVLPGQTGISIIGGHRDTHFEFLETAKMGQQIQIESHHGTSLYQVNNIAIRDSRSEPLSFTGNEDQLVLITCYPFDTLQSGGDMRYVVIAQRKTKGGTESASDGGAIASR